jgi:hypothetical protein
MGLQNTVLRVLYEPAFSGLDTGFLESDSDHRSAFNNDVHFCLPVRAEKDTGRPERITPPLRQNYRRDVLTAPTGAHTIAATQTANATAAAIQKT